MSGSPRRWPSGGGELGALIRDHDWSRTSLGPIAGWPQSLKTTVEILLLSPVPIVLLWGSDGVMIYNDAYSVFAGGRHPLLLGSKVREGWPEVADFNDNVMKVGLGGGTLSYLDQELTLHRSGIPEPVWMNLDYSPVLDESGTPAGVLAIVVETSERIVAQRALARAEEAQNQFAAIIQSSDDAIIGMSLDGIITTWNQGAASIYGYKADEVIGQPVTILLPPGRQNEEPEILARISQGQHVDHYETVRQRKNGSLLDISLTVSPVMDAEGRIIGASKIARDITARNRAEHALRESEERRRMASEAARIGVWDFNLTTNDLRWDERTRALFGLAPDAAVTYETFLAGLHPDDRAATDEAVQRALDPHGSGEYDIEYRTVGLEDGVTRWIAAKGKSYFDGGKPVRFIGTVLDIGASKDAQERQRLLLREMNHRVKNLFAIVSGMIALTARSARTPQDMANSLRGRLNALIRANDLVRPGMMGSEDADGEQTTMEALVKTVLQPYAAEKSGEVRIVVSGPDVPVGAKAVTSLALVLHESATNAAKYGALSAPSGSIRIGWEMQDHDFRLRWTESGGPLIADAPTVHGFGRVLAERSVVGQLGGEIAYDWQPAGLTLNVTIPFERLQL